MRKAYEKAMAEIKKFDIASIMTESNNGLVEGEAGGNTGLPSVPFGFGNDLDNYKI